jgi:hypothetical protein
LLGRLPYKQLGANELLQRLKMAWIALWFVLILSSIAMLAFFSGGIFPQE